ncbi:RNA polymerase sigma factor sigB [Dichanthelium oligosanthes]|uniref:RNA polymerase sigma factor sigB n=1 Tax=Dichanthelium oligosanthes TaxID=888268 RepID=A0A1E5VN98_9POAL|nr:RNA polymerase sigma factor sigB [Dichanthelium oligosanthes]
MACLAPQFKWAPSAAAHTHSSSSRCSALRVHCAITSAAAVVDADRASGGGAAQLRLAYTAPALQRNFESILESEALLNEEAIVEAAAAEAVALARAAAEAAREVVQMVQNNNHQPVIRKNKGVDSYLANEILRTEMQSSSPNGYINDVLLEDLESYGIVAADGIDDDAQYTENIAVKSARQSERRARRTRAAIKAATTVRASQKTSTSSKKKRSKGSSPSMNPLGSLWKMTGRKLLTAKEEVEFSEGIQDLLKLEAIQAELTEYNGGQPTFSQWATAAGTDEKTLRKRLDHGIYCKNRMVTSNVRLVISIAREFEGPGMDLYDLIQAHMIEASYRVKECTKRLRRKLRRRPTNEEIALDTGMPIKRVEAAVNLPKYSVSLDSKIGSTDMTYQEVTADPSSETAEEMLNRLSMKKDVHQALDTLTAREKQVVMLRFGLEDGRIRTLQEIGNIMGVSRERIRQIESGAFRKLRSKNRVKALKDYLMPVGNW